MYGDTKTTKDRMEKKTKTTGILGKRSSALKKKMKCTCDGNKCTCK